MRHLLLFALLFTLTVGCSKKKPPEPEPTGGGSDTKTDPTPADTTDADRTKLLNALKGLNQKNKQDAIEELAVWVDSDPESIAALLDLLKDRVNAGSGRTHPLQINSTREAAARALLLAGPKGEAALKEKGFAALREGLNDKDAAVREHTAYTIGLLGPLAKSLSPDVMKLCTSSDEKVRGAAFDTLRSIGITDVVGFTKLLTNEDRNVINHAAEQISTLTDIPAEAVQYLAAGLDNPIATVRSAIAAALANAGPKAAPAVGALIEAIKISYPPEYDPLTPYEQGSDMAYWRALAAIGVPAVAPTTGLLAHKNLIVRMYAAQTLGEIGPQAKPAVEKLKGALKDSSGNVAIEAACALCRIGEAKDDAVAFVKLAIESTKGEKNEFALTAIDAIPRMGEAGKTLVPLALEQLTNEKNVFARFAAVGLVGTLSPAEAAKVAPALGKLATDAEPLVARRAGMVLEKLGPAGAGAAEALGKAIPHEEDAIIRDQFIDALIAMGQGAKPALPALLPLVADQSSALSQRVRVIAAIAVADPASKQVAAALLAAVGDSDQDIRIVAATAIGKLNPVPADALKKLVAMAKTDRGTKARVAALRALAAVGKQATPVKADVEAIATGKLPEFALLAKVALAAMDGNVSKAGSDIRAALGNKNSQVRSAAAESLLLVGPTAADIPALTKLCGDGNSTTREAAAKCIGRLGSAAKETVPALIKLLEAPEREVQAAAAEALGDIGPAAMPAVEKLKAVRGTGMFDDPVTGPAVRKALEKLGVKDKR
jgi:HEAT repeat protein